jgi:hypothetical protein
MSRHDPCSEAEWILEAIVDDFADSLEPPDRALFYARLAELLLERRDREDRRCERPDSDVPPQIQ